MPHAINFRRILPGTPRKPLTPAEAALRRKERRAARALAIAEAVAYRAHRHQQQIARERFGSRTLKVHPRGHRDNTRFYTAREIAALHKAAK